MQTILNVYKPKGLTPLQTINLLRERLPEYKDKTIGFAGRLDPLAHGVLLLMIGEETTKEKDSFLNLPKQYEFEAVFGVSTDTYDALGLLTVITSKAKQSLNDKIALSPSTSHNDEEKLIAKIQTFIQSKLGKQLQSYPPYSSKTVNGKPLYQWAREGKLSTIKMPTREIEIYDLSLIDVQTISTAKLKEEIMKQIHSVQGDFRQDKIKNTWENFLKNNKNTTFTTARFQISCSSGTYVRSLINELGESISSGAIALEILRTHVGTHSLNNSLHLI